jgi:hypothetical protein
MIWVEVTRAVLDGRRLCQRFKEFRLQPLVDNALLSLYYAILFSKQGFLGEQGRFLTAEDFERIKELRQQRLVDKAMAKHGLKSATKRARLQSQAEDEAAETLRMQVS